MLPGLSLPYFFKWHVAPRKSQTWAFTIAVIVVGAWLSFWVHWKLVYDRQLQPSWERRDRARAVLCCQEAWVGNVPECRPQMDALGGIPGPSTTETPYADVLDGLAQLRSDEGWLAKRKDVDVDVHELCPWLDGRVDRRASSSRLHLGFYIRRSDNLDDPPMRRDPWALKRVQRVLAAGIEPDVKVWVEYLNRNSIDLHELLVDREQVADGQTTPSTYGKAFAELHVGTQRKVAQTLGAGDAKRRDHFLRHLATVGLDVEWAAELSGIASPPPPEKRPKRSRGGFGGTRTRQ